MEEISNAASVTVLISLSTNLGFVQRRTMVERNTEELPLPALFEQARQIHYAASESSVDQVLLPVFFPPTIA